MARWDRHQGLPDLDLERGADEVQFGLALAAEDRGQEGGQGHTVLNIARLRPAGAHVGHCSGAAHVGGEGEPAKPARGRHCKGLAKRCLDPVPADRKTLATACIIAGRHRLPPQEQIMQAAGAGKPCFKRGVEQGEPVGQQAFGVVERQILLIAFRRHPGPLGKHPLKMGWRKADRSGKFFQCWLFGDLFADMVDGAGNQRVVIGIGCHGGFPVHLPST